MGDLDADLLDSPSIILAVYMFIFGLGEILVTVRFLVL